MFRKVTQRTFTRFNSTHGHGHVSKYISENAFHSSKVSREAAQTYKQTYEQKVHHSESVTNLWKKVTYFVALPVLVLTAIPVVNIELKHAKHREHLRHLSDDEWPTQYEYQNLRQKKFFWGDGDKTLFWNSDVNRHIES